MSNTSGDHAVFGRLKHVFRSGHVAMVTFSTRDNGWPLGGQDGRVPNLMARENRYGNVFKYYLFVFSLSRHNLNNKYSVSVYVVSDFKFGELVAVETGSTFRIFAMHVVSSLHQRSYIYYTDGHFSQFACIIQRSNKEVAKRLCPWRPNYLPFTRWCHACKAGFGKFLLATRWPCCRLPLWNQWIHDVLR